jgi:hypothetical protein
MASASLPSRSSTSVIASRVPSTSAAGRSILLMTGTIVQVGVGGQVEVGQRLRLDALGGVDDEHGALAGGQRARDLVGEVDVPGVSMRFSVYSDRRARGRGGAPCGP